MELQTAQQTIYLINGQAQEFLSAYGNVDNPHVREALFNVVKNAVTSDSTVTLSFLDEETAKNVYRSIEDANSRAKVERISVQSETYPNVSYLVGVYNGVPISCTCPDFEHRSLTNSRHVCKHMTRVGSRIATTSRQETQPNNWRANLEDIDPAP